MSGAVRWPAEWEPHAATWLAWPHNVSDWPGKFRCIPWVYCEILRHLVRSEHIRLLVQDETHAARARSMLRRADVPTDRIDFLPIPTDRGWMRDSGPFFVLRGGAPAVMPVRFTGWAKYPDHLEDARTPRRAAGLLSLPVLDAPAAPDGSAFVLEGGAVDGNGAGTVLTTEECLLDPAVQVRNPGADRAEVERMLAAALGARTVLWLGSGIAGDDTHGHVDDCARFAGERTVLAAVETNPADANYRALAENRERLEGMRLAGGGAPEVVPLPMPGPIVFEGRRLPASYANFYVGNAVVLVPTFNDPADRTALGILGECFPERTIVGIHAVDLVWGLGTIHCLTREEPRRGAGC
jgi:agmatine deiminase